MSPGRGARTITWSTIVDTIFTLYFNHHSMTQKWQHVSEFLGGMSKILHEGTSFKGGMKVGGRHERNYVLPLWPHILCIPCLDDSKECFDHDIYIKENNL